MKTIECGPRNSVESNYRDFFSYLIEKSYQFCKCVWCCSTNEHYDTFETDFYQNADNQSVDLWTFLQFRPKNKKG